MSVSTELRPERKVESSRLSLRPMFGKLASGSGIDQKLFMPRTGACNARANNLPDNHQKTSTTCLLARLSGTTDSHSVISRLIHTPTFQKGQNTEHQKACALSPSGPQGPCSTIFRPVQHHLLQLVSTISRCSRAIDQAFLFPARAQAYVKPD